MLLRKFSTAIFVIILTSCSTVNPKFTAGLLAYEKGEYILALQNWRQAAKEKNAEAQHSLGWLYENGEGVPQDYEEAAKWYTLAAGQGLGGAHLNLGNLYDKGKGVEKDYAEAAKHFMVAAKQGFPEAQNNLGLMYKSGQGVPQDYKLAAMWLQRAALQGYPAAQNSLGVLYFKGQGLKQDIEQAYFWFSMAVRNSQSGAVHNRDFSKTFLNREQIEDLNKKAGFR